MSAGILSLPSSMPSLGAQAYLTCTYAILPYEASWAPGPSHTAQGSRTRPEGDPGMVGATGPGYPRPKPGHEWAPEADIGDILIVSFQWGAGPVIP